MILGQPMQRESLNARLLGADYEISIFPLILEWPPADN